MFDPQRLLGQMLGQGMGLGHGKKKRKKGHYGGGGFGGGGMVNKATIGVGVLGVAIAAWEHYNQQKASGSGQAGPAGAPPHPAHAGGAMQQPSPPGLPPHAAPAMPPPPPPPGPAAARAAPAPAAAAGAAPASADAEHLLRTMIAAANADAHVDAEERSAILDQAREQGAAADDLGWLERELANPRTVESVVDATRGGLREATYAAALAALEVDNEAEQRWLERLAEGLRLSPAERDAIERSVAASREA